MRSILYSWQQLSLIDRIRWLRYVVPPLLAVWVIAYQLLFAQNLEAAYGHMVHYGVEIAFYSLAGPAVTWIMLVWVEHRLEEKEALERQMLAQGLSNQEIADRLFLAEKTIRNRLSLIFKRLHLENRTQAALYALREGLVDDEVDEMDDLE